TASGEVLASAFGGCGAGLPAGAAFAAGALLAFAGAFTGLGGSFLAASRRGAGPALAADLGAGAFAAGFGIGFDISDFFLSGKGDLRLRRALGGSRRDRQGSGAFLHLFAGLSLVRVVASFPFDNAGLVK